VWALDGVYPACIAARLGYAVVDDEGDDTEGDDTEGDDTEGEQAELDSVVPICVASIQATLTSSKRMAPMRRHRSTTVMSTLLGSTAKSEIRWNVSLGAEEGDLCALESTFFSRTPVRVLMVGSVATMVNRATGESQPAPVDGIYSCAADREGLNTQFIESVTAHSGSEFDVNTGDSTFPGNAQSIAAGDRSSPGAVCATPHSMPTRASRSSAARWA
jgi:hypothetical protein